MTPALLPLALLTTALSVQIEAELCPSAGEIEAALASMLPASPEAAQGSVARVLRQGERVHVELINHNGALVGRRSLDDSGRCAELAVQVAVVVASLATDVHPEFSQPAHEPPSPAPVVRASEALPRRPATRASFDIAAGLLVSYASSAAVGGSLAAIWVPRGTGLGLRLSAGTETTRSVDLGQGQHAIWRRWTATTEGDWRLSRGLYAFDVHAGLAWTLLGANGEGFQSNASVSSTSLGIQAGVRLSRWMTSRIAGWVGLEGGYWLRRQFVAATVDAPGQQIPRFSTMATLGLALGRAAAGPLGSAGLAAQ